MKTHLVLEKTRAAGLHLFFSAVVAALSATLVFGLWYPYPFREISGGRSMFGILMGVDVVVGPLLTWVVFNRSKPRRELRRDLAVIAVLQVAALIYGVWSMHAARPVYLVHEVDRFVTVSAADIAPADLALAPMPFRKLPWTGVQVIGLRPPSDPQEKLKSIELALAGRDLSLQPQFWQSLSADNRALIRQRAIPLAGLLARGGAGSRLIDDWMKGRGASLDAYLAFPLVARENFWTVVLDKQTLERVGYLPIDPF